METQMLDRNKFISPDDLKLFTLTDDPQEAVKLITDYLRRVGPPEHVPLAFS
jgi:nitrogen regulatory protein PII-like uncharacterized protein